MQNALIWGWLDESPDIKDLFYREVVEEDCYQRFFKVEEGDIVVDIGASVGIFPYKLSERNPKVVYCIEPDPKSCLAIKQNAEYLTFPVHLFTGAISKYDNNVKLNTLINSDTLSFPNILERDNLTEVQGITFRSFCEVYNILKINFLKVDCEGGEYDIFTESNLEWIVSNVNKVAGEWHLYTGELKRSFHTFTSLYLNKTQSYKILTMNNEDITDKVFDYGFINRYEALQIYLEF